jgi:hypothetical protein
MLKCHPFPIPKIGGGDMTRLKEDFFFVSELDLNIWAIITSNWMLILKSYVQFYSHGTWENTNTNAYQWVSTLPGS